MKMNLSDAQLKAINGGKLPILPSWNQLLNGTCGLLDGLTGKKNHGHC